jgi:hypothetical protein
VVVMMTMMMMMMIRVAYAVSSGLAAWGVRGFTPLLQVSCLSSVQHCVNPHDLYTAPSHLVCASSGYQTIRRHKGQLMWTVSG